MLTEKTFKKIVKFNFKHSRAWTWLADWSDFHCYDSVTKKRVSSADKGEFEEALQSYSRFIEQKSLDKRRRPGKNFVNPDSRQFPVKSECVFWIFGTFSEGKFQTKRSFHWRFLRERRAFGVVVYFCFSYFWGWVNFVYVFDNFC